MSTISRFFINNNYYSMAATGRPLAPKMIVPAIEIMRPAVIAVERWRLGTL